MQHLNTTSFAGPVVINYYKSIVKNIDMEQTSSANITTSRSIILNTSQIDLNVVIIQTQLLILLNSFNLSIRDLLNKICQLVTNLQQHLQSITYQSKPPTLTLSDSNMLNVNNTNWVSIWNAHVSIMIITLKSQSSSKYNEAS